MQQFLKKRKLQAPVTYAECKPSCDVEITNPPVRCKYVAPATFAQCMPAVDMDKALGRMNDVDVVEPPMAEASRSSKMSHAMRLFAETYFRKFTALPFEATILRHWLADSKDGFITNGSLANLTLFEGGSFAIPRHMMPEYFQFSVLTLESGKHRSCNEIALNARQCTLCIECDVTYADPHVKHPLNYFRDNLVYPINATVRRYQLGSIDGMRLMVFESELKPKYCPRENEWKLFKGFHLIYNRVVDIATGAQITHAAKVDLRQMKSPLAQSIDNVYLKNGAYTKSPMLRPPYACKMTAFCYFCSDPTSTKRFADRAQVTAKCTACGGYSRSLDTNTYKLAYVLDMDNKPDEKMCAELKSDIGKQLAAASIWGTNHMAANTATPQTEATYTMHQMSDRVEAFNAMTTFAKTELATASKMSKLTTDGKAISLRKGLVQFFQMKVKRKDEKGQLVIMDTELQRKVMILLCAIDPHYQAAGVNRKLNFYNQTRCLNINLEGQGSTYCMVKKDFHTSCAASMWVCYDCNGARIYAGCWSKHCAGVYFQVPHVPTNTTHVEGLIHYARKLISK